MLNPWLHANLPLSSPSKGSAYCHSVRALLSCCHAFVYCTLRGDDKGNDIVGHRTFLIR